MASLDGRGGYARTGEAMFLCTDTAGAPWTAIKSGCKKRARLGAMRYPLHKPPRTGRDPAGAGPDRSLAGRASVVYEQGERQMTAPLP